MASSPSSQLETGSVNNSRMRQKTDDPDADKGEMRKFARVWTSRFQHSQLDGAAACYREKLFSAYRDGTTPAFHELEQNGWPENQRERGSRNIEWRRRREYSCVASSMDLIDGFPRLGFKDSAEAQISWPAHFNLPRTSFLPNFSLPPILYPCFQFDPHRLFNQ